MPTPEVFGSHFNLSLLPDDTARVWGFGDEDAGVLEPDAMSLVVAVPRHISLARMIEKYVDNAPCLLCQSNDLYAQCRHHQTQKEMLHTHGFLNSTPSLTYRRKAQILLDGKPTDLMDLMLCLDNLMLMTLEVTQTQSRNTTRLIALAACSFLVWLIIWF
jgi:hypothetical protein